MSNDVYETPEAELETNDEYSHNLASRWQRLGAAIVDTLVLLVVVIPLFILVGLLFPEYFESDSMLLEMMINLVAGLASVFVFLLINSRLLFSRGKTVGKHLLGITILDSFNYTIPAKNNLVKRYGFYFFIGYVPLVGGIISLINVLFIFSKDKRCIHDNIANTIVVADNK